MSPEPWSRTSIPLYLTKDSSMWPKKGSGTSMSATPPPSIWTSTWMRVSLVTRSSLAIRRDAGPGLISLIRHHPEPDRPLMAAQPLGRGEGAGDRREVVELLGREVHHRLPALEVHHRDRATVARGATGGKGVIGPGHVVAHRDRRDR